MSLVVEYERATHDAEIARLRRVPALRAMLGEAEFVKANRNVSSPHDSVLHSSRSVTKSPTNVPMASCRPTRCELAYFDSEIAQEAGDSLMIKLGQAAKTHFRGKTGTEPVAKDGARRW
ncbi:hypothetical protein [Rarobacter incanus]|uniref:Uncharacterized protein n=1 Tax=Rarobacter incanus TaxID=153494 RepID=A0A542SNC4_9MICO|nr:hypothetical protein [Rarobacter incanus]TQK76005.1 hypothetical protein FB389_0653 [Rarobacter incanus]